MTIDASIFLPPYTMRRSSRARHLRLCINARGQLELIVPKRVSEQLALQFLLEQQPWIIQRQHLLVAPSNEVLPSILSLQAIEQRWDLSFQMGAQRQRVRENRLGLQLALHEPSLDNMTRVLKPWLKRKANIVLTPWLERWSQQMQLPYQSVCYRGQQTRWGSCSADRRICLNYKLLFLPAAHVDYVIVHELCHTVHFNHSPQFWQLVAQYLPAWSALRRSVRDANHYLPLWLR